LNMLGIHNIVLATRVWYHNNQFHSEYISGFSPNTGL